MSKKIKGASGEVIGHLARVKIVKNKTYPPYQVAVVPLYAGKGFDNFQPLIDAAIDLNLIEQRAASYTMAWALSHKDLFPTEVPEKIRGREALETETKSWPVEALDALDAEIRKQFFVENKIAVLKILPPDETTETVADDAGKDLSDDSVGKEEGEN